jgi:hypothetical protein
MNPPGTGSFAGRCRAAEGRLPVVRQEVARFTVYRLLWHRSSAPERSPEGDHERLDR